MVASSPSVQKAPTLQELMAEAHRLYAILEPRGKVQVLIPEGERAQYVARYTHVCALLSQAQLAQMEQKAQAAKWSSEVEDALPELIPLLPAEWRSKVEGLIDMAPGDERDAAVRGTLNALVNSGALARFGAAGVAIAPMVRKFLRKKKP